MVDTQHFCLRWNNYQSSITSAFENLRDDEDFVDVTLACDGKSLKAHRVVLSACSPYFRELLKSTPCKHPVIVLQDVSFPDLHALVEFIYHGEVNVHQRSLSSFLKTAEVLRVSGLTQHDDAHSVQSLAARVAAAASPSTPASPSPVRRLTPHTPLTPLPPLPPLPALPLPPLAPAYADKLEEALSRRRARSPRSPDGKKPRHDNNNTERLSHMPPQATATDFSTRRHTPLSLPAHLISAGGDNGNGNGVCGGSSGSPSPPGRHVDERDVKREPLELLCDVDGRSPPPSPRPSPRPSPHPLAHHLQHHPHPHHHLGPPQQHHHRTHHGVLSRGSSADGGEERTPPPPPPPFLSPSETKLFNPAGTFNFSMAALADHSPLAGLGGGALTDGLAATSQAAAGAGAGEDYRCEPCNKSLSSLTRLKRHIQNVHMRPSREPVCNICRRVYSSLNSLRNHKSIYHRKPAAAQMPTATAAAASPTATGAFCPRLD